MVRERARLSCAAFGVALLAAACAPRGERGPQEDPATRTIRLASPAFADGAAIPARHTCDGGDVSPPLRWTNVPKGTRSLVLLCDDPDAPAGDWVHWAIFGIP